MIKKGRPKFKNTAEMLSFLKEMRKKSEATIKKMDAKLKREEKKYQQEIADFQRKYGE